MKDMNSPTVYKKIPKYKYKLEEDFYYELSITGYRINHPYIKLKKNGQLIILKGYAWDGASGPTIDTKNSMRASLVHDALYQLFRLELLPQSLVKTSDKIFKDILVEDGMSKVRAWIWYKGLRLANGSAAKPKEEPKIISIK